MTVLAHEVRERFLVCRPEGDLEEASGDRIAELASSSEAEGVRTVVLDLGGTPYVSSRGVASLLRLQSNLAARRRGLALAAPSPLVRRILYQAGVVAVLPIHLTVEEACARA